MAACAAGLVFLTLVSAFAFTTIVVFGVVQNIPNNGIFNKTIPEISRKYPSAIEPADYAFGIWGLIYLFQLGWLGYAFSAMCRSNRKGLVMMNPVVMPKKYHIAYSLACITATLWYFIFAAEQHLLCALDLFIGTMLGFGALLVNMQIVAKNEKSMARNMSADLICIRVLVQNGLGLFFTWSLFATLIAVSMALTYDPNSPFHLSEDDAGSLCLYALSVIIVIASVLENTTLFSLTKYLYSWYFVLFWALSGMIVRFPQPTRKNTIITIVLLCVSVVCFAAKITVYCLTPKTVAKKSKKYKLLEEDDIDV